MSFADFAFEQLQRHGSKTFLIDAGSGRRMTFTEVLTESRHLTRWIRARVGPSQVACLCARSRAEYLPAFLGVAAAGAVACQVNPEFTSGEMRDTFERVSPALIVCDTDNLQVVQEAKPQHAQVLVFGECPAWATSYEEALRQGSRLPQRPLTLPDGAALHLLFSSGTTGLPKPVLVGHAARIANAYQLSNPEVRMFESQDVVLLILPLYLMFATVLWSVALLEGATIVLLPRFRPETFLAAIQDHRVSAVPLAPPLVLFMLDCPLVEEFDTSSLRHVICGGAPLPPSLGEDLRKKFNLKTCRQGYGLTEAGHLTLLPLHAERQADSDPRKSQSESIGRPLPGTELQVRDFSTGRPLGPLQRGELCFRGPQLMMGYLDNPAATQDMIDADGWLRTGDVGYVDGSGLVHFVERAKDLIKSKGHQVSPAELEGLLLQHPRVKDAAVLGLPDLYAGELPLAFVVVKTEHGLPPCRAQDIANFVAERTCRQKHLTGGVRFLDSIPKTASGKILRRKLREVLAQQQLQQDSLAQEEHSS